MPELVLDAHAERSAESVAAMEDLCEEVVDVLRAAGAAATVHRTAEELCLSATEEASTAVVILDASERQALIRALARRRLEAPHAAIVVICDRPSVGAVRSLLLAGVRGVVVREQIRSTLVPTLDAVASGQVCVPCRHTCAIERPVLSIREKQVVGLVTMGLMNSEIAERLFLAESTVKSHLSSAFAKLGVRSRHEAVELVINPDYGLGQGILPIGAEPSQTLPAEVRAR